MNVKSDLIKWKVSYGMWQHAEVMAADWMEAMREAIKVFRTIEDKAYLIKVNPA